MNKVFMNLAIRAKLLVGFGIVIALSLGMAIFSVVQLNEVRNNYGSLLDGAVTRSQTSLLAQSNVRAVRRTLTGMVMHAPTANVAAINSL